MMNKLITRTTLLAAFTLGLGAPLLAQGVTVSGGTDHLGYVGRTYRDIQGSPFLFDNWQKGTVRLRNGTVHTSLDLKYDQVADELIFLSPTGQEQKFADRVAEFTLPAAQGGSHRFFSGFAPIDGARESSFYELVADGPTRLLKRTTKKIVEERAPNSNILKIRQVRQHVKYYVALPDQQKLTLVRKDQKSVLTAFSNRRSEVEQYLKTQGLNLKEEQDLVKLTNYYNTL
jgi:hypothetical protein